MVIGTLSVSGVITDELTTWILDALNLGKGGEYYETIGSFLWWFLYILIKLSTIIILSFIGGGLTLVLMSPVLAYLSEKTETIVKGVEYPFKLDLFIKDVVRGVVIATRNTIIQVLLVIMLMSFSLIPVVGWVSPFFMFLVGAYFYGFSFLDYTCERNRLTMKESIRFMRQNKGLTIGNGAIFSIVVIIPWVGSFLSGFVAVVSVVAATLSVYEAEEKKLLG